MILQRLVEYYDRLAVDPATADAMPKPGYSLQKISFCVVLNPDGTLNQIASMLREEKKKLLPQMKLVPGQSKPSGSGLNPCFLWDNAAYMLGVKFDDEAPDRTKKAFEAFRDRHVSIENDVNDPAFSAVCTFLKNWNPAEVLENRKEYEPRLGSFGVFRLASEMRFVHEDPKVLAYWASHDAAEKSEAGEGNGFCLITGRREPIARLHQPAIKGVRDAQSSGALLVSFNDNAYESYGKEQGENAPVSAAAAFKYTNALNHLLARDERKVFLGDATVVFWAEKPNIVEDAAAMVWGEQSFAYVADDAPAEHKARVNQVGRFLKQLRQGYSTGEAIDAADKTGFYVLGLSPNASRISVRFWYDGTIGELKKRLARYLRDIELVGKRDDERPLSIKRLVTICGRAIDKNGGVTYDDDAVPPTLEGAVARAVLFGTPYPRLLLNTLLNRIRADGDVRHDRVAGIKAYLIRTSRDDLKEVPVALDTTRTEPAYVTGRLFALLEKIQSDSAGGDLNATIKDRYFSAASATPGLVFPRLIRLSNHHLAKMETPQKIYYERQLGEVMGKLDRFASHMLLEDQGLFAVGYFHQRQDLFTKRTKDSREQPKEEGAVAL